MWLHVNNCCKGAVACLYHEGGITGIMFYHQTGGPIIITGWACKWEAYNWDIKVVQSHGYCAA